MTVPEYLIILLWELNPVQGYQPVQGSEFDKEYSH